MYKKMENGPIIIWFKDNDPFFFNHNIQRASETTTPEAFAFGRCV